MMFFKSAFALYLAAIALAAPAPKPQNNNVPGDAISDLRTLSLNPCLLCTSLSIADMSVTDLSKVVDDLLGAGVNSG